MSTFFQRSSELNAHNFHIDWRGKFFILKCRNKADPKKNDKVFQKIGQYKKIIYFF